MFSCKSKASHVWAELDTVSACWTQVAPLLYVQPSDTFAMETDYLSTTHFHDNAIKHFEAAILCGKWQFDLNRSTFSISVIAATAVFRLKHSFKKKKKKKSESPEGHIL